MCEVKAIREGKRGADVGFCKKQEPDFWSINYPSKAIWELYYANSWTTQFIIQRPNNPQQFDQSYSTFWVILTFKKSNYTHLQGKSKHYTKFFLNFPYFHKFSDEPVIQQIVENFK